MKEDMKKKVENIVVGNCNIFGELVNSQNNSIKYFALAAEKEHNGIVGIFYQDGRDGEKEFGIGNGVIKYDSKKVCHANGSYNLTALEAYRSFQYKMDRNAGILWHCAGWNELLETVEPLLLVSIDQVTSRLWHYHEEEMKWRGYCGDAVDLISYETFTARALRAIGRDILDGDLPLDNAWYKYEVDKLKEDLDQSVDFAEKYA